MGKAVPLENLLSSYLALEDVCKVDVLVHDGLLLFGHRKKRVALGLHVCMHADRWCMRTSSGNSFRPRMMASRGAFFHDPCSACRANPPTGTFHEHIPEISETGVVVVGYRSIGGVGCIHQGYI